MKPIFAFFLSVILLTGLIAVSTYASGDNNLYLKDSLKLQLDIDGQFDLIPADSSATLKEVKADLLFYPQEDFRQKLLEISTDGEVAENKVTFLWDDGQIESKQFYYSAIIKTDNEKLAVKNKIDFPLTVSQTTGLEEYLEQTETIDSENPAVIAKAAELIEGEDDLFKVVFSLANWVENNINYDLNTLTAGASQKASWVLENKQGVCDEMTSLFVAMCRSVGIPARFVSGISYTTSELFEENWQPHGWAEIYFPQVGWVGFDITFGEYGYIDVTHIKLRDSADPSEPATKFEWLANKVNLDSKNLQFVVNLLEKGDDEQEEIQLEQELLSNVVGIGSYNLVKGILKNTADNYAATTLRLAIPKELTIVGENKRTILLKPKEVKETYWVVKVPTNLDSEYWYTFPTNVYSEKNVSVLDSFKVVSGSSYYSLDEIKEFTIKDEEKTYSRKISFNCQYEQEMKLGESQEVVCTIKNVGNTNLQNVDFCLGEICKVVDISINQVKINKITIEGEEAGWQKLLVSAENDFIEKKSSLEYAVLDNPLINATIFVPKEVDYGKTFTINITLEKSSFNQPLDVVVILELPGRENKWEIEQLGTEKELTLDLEAASISNNNKVQVTTMWKDQESKLYSDKQSIQIVGKGNNLGEKFILFFNGIINWFI